MYVYLYVYLYVYMYVYLYVYLYVVTNLKLLFKGTSYSITMRNVYF